MREPTAHGTLPPRRTAGSRRCRSIDQRDLQSIKKRGASQHWRPFLPRAPTRASGGGSPRRLCRRLVQAADPQHPAIPLAIASASADKVHVVRLLTPASAGLPQANPITAHRCGEENVAGSGGRHDRDRRGRTPVGIHDLGPDLLQRRAAVTVAQKTLPPARVLW